MTLLPVTLLTVAKAPEPGRAKTRLAATVGDEIAAQIAAAALLDTLDAVAATPVMARVVALTGNVHAAAESAEIRCRLESFTVIGQRGDDFADRLANAHADAGATGHPVLQIGMDTPQVTEHLLASCARQLLTGQAVLGPALDGGWWTLGLPTPAAAECLRVVPMSRSDTGALTLKALRDSGIDVIEADLLADFDVVDDVAVVRAACSPASRFARVTHAAGL